MVFDQTVAVPAVNISFKDVRSAEFSLVGAGFDLVHQAHAVSGLHVAEYLHNCVGVGGSVIICFGRNAGVNADAAG